MRLQGLFSSMSDMIIILDLKEVFQVIQVDFHEGRVDTRKKLGRIHNLYVDILGGLRYMIAYTLRPTVFPTN